MRAVGVLLSLRCRAPRALWRLFPARESYLRQCFLSFQSSATKSLRALAFATLPNARSLDRLGGVGLATYAPRQTARVDALHAQEHTFSLLRCPLRAAD